jgi:RNA polymerase sigma-70 factor (ECF subfamily)
MVGSVHEAEELVQEAFLQAWRRRETYEGRAPFRAWLYKIATNLCLDALKHRRRRTLPIAQQAASTMADPIQPPATEPIWLGPFPDDLLAAEEDSPEARYTRRESVTLAFMICLHLLPPRQRAVLIMRDVMDWQASEVADLLSLTVPAVKSALHRARTTLRSHYQAVEVEDVTERSLDETQRNLLERYVRAWEAADVEGLVALLKDDATFSMPPIPNWYRGHADIRAFVTTGIFSGQPQRRWRLYPTGANAQPAFGVYRWNDKDMIYQPYGIQVVALSGQFIAHITTFKDPNVMPLFKLLSVD